MAHPVRVSLMQAFPEYEDAIRVHTAVSTPVARLNELFLFVSAPDFEGVGEVRANVAFLTGIEDGDVPDTIRTLVRALDWQRPLEQLIEDVGSQGGRHPSIARAIVESALVDALARQRGEPMAVTLGGQWSMPLETSNCLFWSEDAVFDSLAERYVREGFRHIKVRVGIQPDFSLDVDRLRRLRERYGDRIGIAIDANGSWPLDIAIERLRAIEPIGIDYAEQPTPPGDWEAFEALARATSIPVMADEGLRGESDLEALARIGAPALAHLKIIKSGGPKSVVRHARFLINAGVGIMAGQMNEGGLATAAIAQASMAFEPRFRELYGCYGLIDDPGEGLTFKDGCVHLPRRPGTGVTVDRGRLTPLWVEGGNPDG